jgi:hypothetical protein
MIAHDGEGRAVRPPIPHDAEDGVDHGVADRHPPHQGLR